MDIICNFAHVEVNSFNPEGFNGFQSSTFILLSFLAVHV